MKDDTTNLLALLKKITTEQEYDNPDIKISPLSTGGANYSSRLYLIKISSDDKQDLQLFAKIAALGEKMREQTSLKPFDCERFMYTELVNIYRELEEKYGVSEHHKLAVPKYYGADDTHLQEILVLEDLSSRGFTLHNRLESVTWPYAAAAVTELAKFHALSLAFAHYDPVNFNRVTNIFHNGMFTDHEGNNEFRNVSVKTALAAVREENKEKLRKFLDGVSMVRYSRMYNGLSRTVLINADFRPSNILHRYKKDGTLELMVVDYQTIQAGCPVIDLLYFMFTATDGQFRARHYQELIDHYHSELGAALARLGLDIEKEYSRKNFEFDLKDKLSYGLQMTVLFLHILLIDEEGAPALDGELSMDQMVVKATGDLYASRLNEVVDQYVTWGVLV